MTLNLAEIQAIAFDVDGVLTDGSIWWGPAGEEWKRFSFTDIMGVSLARRLGIALALISGEASPLVDRYAEKLRMGYVAKGCRDKAAALRDFASVTNVDLTRTCFVGDDVNDLFAMEIAGFCACPANAADDVREYVGANGFVASRNGGQGAVRELVDQIVKARGLRGKDVFLLRPPE